MKFKACRLCLLFGCFSCAAVQDEGGQIPAGCAANKRLPDALHGPVCTVPRGASRYLSSPSPVPSPPRSPQLTPFLPCGEKNRVAPSGTGDSTCSVDNGMYQVLQWSTVYQSVPVPYQQSNAGLLRSPLPTKNAHQADIETGRRNLCYCSSPSHLELIALRPLTHGWCTLLKNNDKPSTTTSSERDYHTQAGFYNSTC